MKLDFAKLNGLGNDFIFIDDRACALNLSVEQVKSLCDRHFGIGADGVILVRPAKNEGSVAYMHYINSDGTLAEMCGNGVRCFAKYVIDRHFPGIADDKLVVDTMAGPKPITFKLDEVGKMKTATVDMGEPILDAHLIPVTATIDAKTTDGKDYVSKLGIPSPWGVFNFTCVSMGNPHAICFINDWGELPDALFANDEKNLANFDVAQVGSFFESHQLFPDKTNVEFATCAKDSISMRVFERGCGETLACGTGTCACSVAATLNGYASRENDVCLLGGTLHIKWDENNHVFMTGAAQESFIGSIAL